MPTALVGRHELHETEVVRRAEEERGRVFFLIVRFFSALEYGLFRAHHDAPVAQLVVDRAAEEAFVVDPFRSVFLGRVEGAGENNGESRKGGGLVEDAVVDAPALAVKEQAGVAVGNAKRGEAGNAGELVRTREGLAGAAEREFTEGLVVDRKGRLTTEEAIAARSREAAGV